MVDKQTVLKAEHVAKSFGKKLVLREVDLQIHPGEIIGVVGENGAGKSTLLKILVGLLTPSAGKITAYGRVGYCPQELMVFETLTVLENFRYFAAAYGLDRDGPQQRWQETKDDLLQRFHFQQYENDAVAHLSGGTKQKLNLALALFHTPEILILDEPYAGFDWETYLHFWDFAAALRSRGDSVLIVSHFVYDRSQFDTLFELSEGVLRCL